MSFCDTGEPPLGSRRNDVEHVDLMLQLIAVVEEVQEALARLEPKLGSQIRPAPTITAPCSGAAVSIAMRTHAPHRKRGR